MFRKGELKPLAPRVVTSDNGETVELSPRVSSHLNIREKQQLGRAGETEKVVGAWK
jgi:hypothetical protein